MKIPRCLICNKRNAIKIEPLGWLPCKTCRERQKSILKPTITAEITTDQIKEDRRYYKKDLLQPFRDGHLSKEFVKAYPQKTKQMIEEGHITESDIDNMQNVWELDYYKEE